MTDFEVKQVSTTYCYVHDLMKQAEADKREKYVLEYGIEMQGMTRLMWSIGYHFYESSMTFEKKRWYLWKRNLPNYQKIILT